MDAFAAEYGRVWHREGWGSRDPDYLLNLPYRDISGRHPGKWRVKARSLKALLSFLDGRGALTIADLGAGVGWLAYHLTLRGHRVIALDAAVEPPTGLGSARHYVETGARFLLVRGEIERPPLLADSVDVAIYNASLHYARSVESALRQARRILRTEGWCVVMNSPVHRDPGSAERAQSDYRHHLETLGASREVSARYRHFTRDYLLRLLLQEVGPVMEVPFDPGRGFRMLRRAKGLVLGMELASFPLWAATKA